VKRDDDLAEWYAQTLTRGKFISYYDVQGIQRSADGIQMNIADLLLLGCYILEPSIYFVWEQIREYFDKKIKAIGTDSIYLWDQC
jgi:prolyl-tRNA synthetase